MEQGLVTKIFSWGTHPTFSEGTAFQWFIGLIAVVMLALLWAQVTLQITD